MSWKHIIADKRRLEKLSGIICRRGNANVMTWAGLCDYKNGNEWYGREAVMIDGAKCLRCFLSLPPSTRTQQQSEAVEAAEAVKRHLVWYCAKCWKWSNNMTWALECFLQSAANVSEHRKWMNVHYMMAYAKLIIVLVKHGHRGWCEYMKLCVVDLPTQVQATFPVEIWLERGQYYHTSHGF